ncbi:MAG: DMT family transporter [Chloroflexi bacterium]|nr:DMT family transporter [Chloroflexota bacterium]
MDRLGIMLALIAGIVIAVQGPMNTTLMRTLGVFGASVAFYAVAFAVAIACTALFGAGFADPGARGWPDVRTVPWWAWLSGVTGVVVVSGLAISVDRLGVTTTAVVLLVGELGLALVLDHFGLLGAPKVAASPMRVLGVLLAVVSIVLLRPE